MKESLQEATQRALLEGYKNLKENKSKKVEAKLEDIQMEIYEMIQTARNVDKQDKETNIKETIYAMKLDYPEIDEKELSDYVTKKADEIYAGDYDEEEIDEKELARQLYGVDNDCEYTPPVKESKKVEAYNYNWRDDIDEVENTEENDELVYAFAENLMNTDPDYAEYDDPWEIISNIISIWKINKRSRLYDYLIKWYGSEEEMKKHVRSFYETNDAIYFETGCGYSIFDADLLGGNADGETARAFDTFVANGGVKEESKKVEEAKLNFINNVDELPDMCYGLLPSDSSIIIIKKGESGYYETDLGSPENAEEVVNDLNEKMGVTPDQRFTMEIRSINNNWEDTKTESKKVEAKEDTTSAPDYLEKAFEVEVEYWLKALVDENSNDEIGKKAQEVLDDKAKMKSIVDELVNGSDDLWEDIHRRIEELAGLHYRESSRVNENKKVTEGLIDSVADYIILRDYNDYKSNDPWQELFVFDHKLSDEEKDKIQKAIDEAKEDPDYDNELVEEKINEVVPFVSNEILKFDEGKIFYY